MTKPLIECVFRTCVDCGADVLCLLDSDAMPDRNSHDCPAKEDR